MEGTYWTLLWITKVTYISSYKRMANSPTIKAVFSDLPYSIFMFLIWVNIHQGIVYSTQTIPVYYQHNTVKDFDACVKRVNGDLVSTKSCSSNTNLIYNLKNTKTLIFSTTQMSRLHKLHDNLHVLKSSDVPLERVSSYEVFRATVTEDLSGNDFQWIN